MDIQVKEKILFLLKKNFDYESFLKKNNLEQKKKIKEMSEISIEWKKLNEEKLFYLNLIEFDSENFLNKEEEKLAKQEIAEIEKKESFLIGKIEELLTTKEEENQKESCIIEIRSGAGGNESKLFVSEVLQMYLKFSEIKKWKVEMMNSKIDNLGGFSFVSFLIKGKDSFKILKNESGVHRVQRIPETENKGRIQTSTVTVVVLQELEDIVVKIDDKDIRIDTYRSSGAGGQHVNTTDSAVRITHIPTGIFTTSQDGRSQIENKKYALTTLKSLVYEKYRKNQENEVGSIRSGAIRNSERSEKIRTYNFQKNRVTDHRIGFQVNKLESFMNGDIDDLCIKLMEFEKKLNYNKESKLKFVDIFIEKMKKNNEKDL